MKRRVSKIKNTYQDRRLKRSKDWLKYWCQLPSFERLNPEE